MNITIVGAGKFGSALGKVLESKHPKLVDVEPDGSYSDATKEAIKNADLLVVAIPSAFVDDAVPMLKPLLKDGVRVISCVKGLYVEGSLKTPSQKLSEGFGVPVAVLSGPNISTELMEGKPAMTVIAGAHAGDIYKLFKTETFRPVHEFDAVGAEIGGAFKNIVALGCGLMSGFFDSANAVGSFFAYATKELEELYGYYSLQSGEKRSLPHLSFWGDLFTTCSSPKSRNNSYGLHVGRLLKEGKDVDKPTVTTEGYRTLRMVHEYAKAEQVSMPVVQALYRIIFENGKVDEIVASWG